MKRYTIVKPPTEVRDGVTVLLAGGPDKRFAFAVKNRETASVERAEQRHFCKCGDVVLLDQTTKAFTQRFRPSYWCQLG
jgi:hypothetical protein